MESEAHVDQAAAAAPPPPAYEETVAAGPTSLQAEEDRDDGFETAPDPDGDDSTVLPPVNPSVPGDEVVTRADENPPTKPNDPAAEEKGIAKVSPLPAAGELIEARKRRNSGGVTDPEPATAGEFAGGDEKGVPDAQDEKFEDVEGPKGLKPVGDAADVGENDGSLGAVGSQEAVKPDIQEDASPLKDELVAVNVNKDGVDDTAVLNLDEDSVEEKGLAEVWPLSAAGELVEAEKQGNSGVVVGSEPATAREFAGGAEKGVPDAQDEKFEDIEGHDVILGAEDSKSVGDAAEVGENDDIQGDATPLKEELVAANVNTAVPNLDEESDAAFGLRKEGEIEAASPSEDLKTMEEECSTVEDEKAGAGRSTGSDQDVALVTASLETLNFVAGESDASVVGAENGAGSEGGLLAVDSENVQDSADKPDGRDVFDRTVGVGGAADDANGGFVSVVVRRSVDKHDAEDDQESVTEATPPNQGTGDEKTVLESSGPVAESSTVFEEESRSREVEPVSISEREVKPGDVGARVVASCADDGEKLGPEDSEEEEEEGSVSDMPARFAILESSETAKQIIKEMGEGSTSASSLSGFGSSAEQPQNTDGQIVMDSDDEVDTDEEGDGSELFDSAALTALLKAATGASSDGGITIPSQDGTRTFSVDRPAGLASSIPALRPAASRLPQLSPFMPSDLSVVREPENDMDEDEEKLQEKVDQIRVKFLRLVQRLGHSSDDTVAAQVLYRLGLAEGIKRGRQISRTFSIDNAKKKALQLEGNTKEDLNFSCNILVIGKTGVGKSATINSIFGEGKAHTNAFQPATPSVSEISGSVDGVKIRVIDTPGLKASVMDQAANRKVLQAIKKYTNKCPPDIVLYVDRMDTQTRDFNDLPLLRSITSILGSSIWFNAIVALSHAASAPPEGPNGSPLSYEVFVAQRSHVVQHSIRQAAGDMRLMNPVALVENHPSCRRNREGERVLPNGLSWRSQLLLLCYSSKILSEANSLLKLQDPSPGKLFGFRFRSPPLPYLLSSLLQSRAHPKLSADQGGDSADSDIDLDDMSDTDKEEEEDEYDQLPPFKPLRKAQIAKLSKEQKRAYFDEYDYRVKLLQKKQWKEELRRLKEMKKKGKIQQDNFAYGDMVEDYDQDGAPAVVPVPLPDMVLPPSFDCDQPVYRYRFLEPTSQLLIRPVLDSHGWDHDCGYDGVSIEENLAVGGRFPAGVAVQITKDKKEFNIHLDSSIAAKHGVNGSTLAGFDIQSIGKQLAYILHGESKFKNLKKNKTTAGISVTFLGETVATGLKVEDQVSIGKRVNLVASTGAIRAQGDLAYGANLEIRLRDKDYPIGQALSTLGLSLMRWHSDLALGANLQSQFSIGRNSKMAVRVGLNNKLTGQVTIRTSTSEQLQIALVGILPLGLSLFRSIFPGESYMVP